MYVKGNLMGLLDLFKGKKNGFLKDQPDDEAKQCDEIFVTLHVAGRYRPMDREYIEEPLEIAVTNMGIGFVDGGGTLLDQEGRIEYCDVTFLIKPEGIAPFIDAANRCPTVPKGSEVFYLEGETPITVPVGTAECLALHLSNQLDEHVYEENNINDLIENIQDAMADNCVAFTHYQSEDVTSLYFYCKSYADAEVAISSIVGNHPLCEGATPCFDEVVFDWKKQEH